MASMGKRGQQRRSNAEKAREEAERKRREESKVTQDAAATPAFL